MILYKTRVTIGAYEYLTKKLGWKTLSKQILEFVNLKDDQYYTFLPASYSDPINFEGRISDLKIDYVLNDGSKIEIISNFAEDAVVQIIQRHLNSNSNNLAVIEEPLLKPNDLLNELETNPYQLAFENEVYYALNDQATNQEIEKNMNLPPFWQCVIVLTTSLCKVTELSAETVTDLARASQTIIVDAFDGEGYVIWEKNPSS